MSDRARDLAKDALEALHELLGELLARKSGGHLVEARREALQLELALALEADPELREQAALALVGACEALIDDAVERAAAFRPGRAYCHRCAGTGCEHARPPSCRHVFVGYAVTGLPRWEDFAQMCLELKEPDVAALYQDPPALIVLVQSAATLEQGLLGAFRNPSYELLGQVVAGFFPVRARLDEGRGIVALTIQIAGSRSRLGLNVLGLAPSGEDLGVLWERQRELPWRRGVRWAQSALDGLRGTHARASRVEGILHGLARRLAREQRGRGRRTQHAESRHAAGLRPTRNALEDARRAGRDALYVDERRATLVVLGERGRTHFFTREGLLVSSVRYSREAIARKLSLALWRPALPDEALAFADRIENRGQLPNHASQS